MVAFIVIGVHNWQTTAPRAAERRQLETSVFLQPRGGAGRLLGVLVSAGWGGEEEGARRTGGAGRGPSPLLCSPKLLSLLLPTPPPQEHTYTEKFCLYMVRHVLTQKHTQTAISKGFSPSFIQNF